MADSACCTCATLLSAVSPLYDEKTEKPIAHERRLECCGRIICGKCLANNKRFSSYCPFCQISSSPSTLPAQGLRDPPAYSSPPPSPQTSHITYGIPPEEEELPAYSATNTITARKEKDPSNPPAEDVLHFLDPSQDTIQSLSLKYGVPHEALRRKNNLFADHLLAARRTVLIPGEYYKGGISLSPEPLENEEEEIRKTKVRRWMVACKVADVPMRLRYDIALLYLQQANYDLDLAVETYLSDDRWEKEHPLAGSSKARGTQDRSRRKPGVRMGLSGQL